MTNMTVSFTNEQWAFLMSKKPESMSYEEYTQQLRDNIEAAALKAMGWKKEVD